MDDYQSKLSPGTEIVYVAPDGKINQSITNYNSLSSNHCWVMP
jgi:hypothetical protein